MKHGLGILFGFVWFIFLSGCQPQSEFIPQTLKCDYRINPLSVDHRHPVLSWMVQTLKRNWQQSGYHIRVASSIENLKNQQGDLWDTGQVKSNQSVHIRYNGQPLQSGQYCYWQVRVWDQKGDASEWSEPAYWCTGKLNDTDWQGKWISTRPHTVLPDKYRIPSVDQGNLLQYQIPTPDTAAVLMRKTVALDEKIKRANAYVCGLGYYELVINGRKVGNRVLDPGFTDYGQRVLYVIHDITDYLQTGTNVIGVILGNAFYNIPTLDLFNFRRAYWHAPPKCLLNIDIRFENNSQITFSTDETWKWSTGKIVFNCIRGGESIDWNKTKTEWQEPDYDDSAWQPVVIASPPAGQLAAQSCPPMRVTETIPAKTVTEPNPNLYVVDFGRNITGWIRMRVRDQPGQKITFKFNEILNPDGTLNTEHSAGHTHGRFQTGELILDKRGEGIFEPRFCYHGFKYVQIKGLRQKPDLNQVVAKSVHTDLQSVGSFECSHEKINQLQQAVRQTLLNSAHSIPGEEPTREKMGWTQDAQNTMESYLFNFNSAMLYRKYLMDMIDNQEDNGHVPPIVPTNGWGLTLKDNKPMVWSDPWWGGTLLDVAWRLYLYYGDRTLLETAYQPMKRFVEYLRFTADDLILSWWLGDWNEADPDVDGGRPVLTPVEQTSTAAFYHYSILLSRVAELLDHKDDAQEYRQLAEKIKKRFNEKFLDYQTGLYAKNSQSAQVVPLYLDMVPAEIKSKVEKQLIDLIHAKGDHLNTGFVGVMPLMYYLVQSGHAGLAYKIATREDNPGWVQMLDAGGGTVGENLNARGYGTNHHPFGTCIGAWFYSTLAGIQPDPKLPGFKRIIIKPEFISDLDWVNCEFDCIYGRIESSWQRKHGQLELNLTIPANTTARVFLPAGRSVTEGKHPLEAVKDIHVRGMKGDRLVCEIGSGTYTFQIKD